MGICFVLFGFGFFCCFCGEGCLFVFNFLVFFKEKINYNRGLVEIIWCTAQGYAERTV